jgi:hypothetical protein
LVSSEITGDLPPAFLIMTIGYPQRSCHLAISQSVCRKEPAFQMVEHFLLHAIFCAIGAVGAGRLAQIVPKMEHLRFRPISLAKLFGVGGLKCGTIWPVIGCGKSHAPEKSGQKHRHKGDSVNVRKPSRRTDRSSPAAKRRGAKSCGA